MSRARPDMKRACTAQSGFSVVEALVALFVFAVAGVGLVELQTRSLATLNAVESQSMAGLIAQNRLVEISASTSAPELGEQAGEISLGGRDWVWLQRVEQTTSANTLRVTVAVRADGAPQDAAVMNGFVSAGKVAP